MTIPAGTLLGWSAAPGQAGSWGLLDPGDTRAIVQAASLHPRTRWCVTVTGPDGTAVAHGCARGRHPWTPGPGTAGPHQQTGGGRDGPGTARDGPAPPGQPASRRPGRTPPRRHSSTTCCAGSTSPSTRSPKANATTSTKTTATHPAGCSRT